MKHHSSFPRMRAHLLLWFPILLSVPLLGSAPASAQENPGPLHTVPEVHNGAAPIPGVPPEDRLVVKFKDSAGALESGKSKRGNAYGQVARILGVTVEELRLGGKNTAIVKASRQLSAYEAGQVAAVLGSSPDVEYAEVDTFLRPAALTPNDTYYSLQWNLFEATGGVGVSGAWDRSAGAGQTVAVIDTGITDHSEFNNRMAPGYDFISDPAIARDGNGRDNNPQDEGDWCGTDTSSWHGTHVAGTIGAAANNDEGIAGIAYAAKIQPLRALGACGGYMSDVADAITWAVGGTVAGIPQNMAPARVVNLSLGASGTCSTTMQNALTYAADKGAVVVVAAGNDNQPATNSSPANCNNVITVGSTTREGARAPYSNYGPGVDISAPGGSQGNSIASTWNSGTTTPAMESYAYMMGTSMAAPHVAGVAALMLAADPGLSPSQVKDTIKKTARPLPVACDTTGCGAGILDATNALAGLPDTPPAPEPEPQPLMPAAAAITGPAAVGAILTADEGSWSPEPVTFSYQWTRNGEAISLATQRTYTLTEMDLAEEIAVIITGSKPSYTPASTTSPPVTVRPFIDVESDYVFAPEVAWLATHGISNGWTEPDGTKTYRPALAVSRDAMAAFMYRLAGRPAYTPPSTSPFADVATDHAFYKEIAWLATSRISNGWTEPNGTKTYRPTLAVSRDAMAAFMYRYATTAATS